MSLEALLAELTRSAEAEEARIRADAHAREAELTSASLAALERQRDSELARISAEERSAVARATAAAERSTRLAVLEARAGLMDAMFTRAEATLSKLEGTRYIDGLPRLVDATLPYLDGRGAVLHCRPDVASVVRAASGKAADAEVQASPECEAGLLGKARDGTLVVDNRLTALLLRRRDELGIALARRLEGL